MYSTFLITVLFCTVTQTLFVNAALEAEGIDAGGELYKNVTIRNERLLSKVKPDTGAVKFYADPCGGKLTRDPISIAKSYYFKYMPEGGEKCTWTIEAPENHQIYVSRLYYEASLYAFEDEPITVDTYFDAPALNIYDGPEVNESKRLFRLGEATLNNALSTGRHMVIDVSHKISDTFSAQKFDLNIYFVKSSDLPKDL